MPETQPKQTRRKQCHEPLPGREPLEHRDTQLLESAAVWCSDKARKDGTTFGIPSHLWCVHGKLYDLSNFKHPGGQTWLNVTKGSDITVAFETHHPLAGKKAKALLQKFYVKDAPRKGPYPFTFEEGDFYATLRTRAAKVLRKSGGSTGPTVQMRLACGVILATFFACFLATAAFRPESLAVSVVFAMATGVTMHALLGVGHNFFHQADNAWMYVFDLTMFSSRNWRVTHAISHHLYPNTELDTEVSSLEPILYFMSNKPRNGTIVYLSFHVFLMLASTVDYLHRWVSFLTMKERFQAESLIVVAEYLILLNFHTWDSALLLFLIMHWTSSYLLASLSFPVHRTEYLWTEGDPGAQTDYGRHIMATTHDHTVRINILAAMFLFAGLNYHCLHHLFPTVDRSRLPLLDNVFQKTLKEFGVEYKKRSYLDLYLSTFRRHDMLVLR